MNKFTSVIISLLVCVALNAEARPQLTNLLSLGTSLAGAVSDAAASATAAGSNALSTAANTGLGVISGGTSTTKTTTAVESATNTMSDLSTGVQNTISKGIEEGQNFVNAFQKIFASWVPWGGKTAAKIVATQAAASADSTLTAITG